MKNFNSSGMFDHASTSSHKNESSLTTFVILFASAEILLLLGAIFLFGELRGMLLTCLAGIIVLCGWKESNGSTIQRLKNVGLLLALYSSTIFVLWLCGLAFNRAFAIQAPCFELAVAEGAVLYAAFFTCLFNYRHIVC